MLHPQQSSIIQTKKHSLSNWASALKKFYSRIYSKKLLREDQVICEALLHIRTEQTLLFPYPDCRLDHEEIKINRINARIYQNFLVVDGQMMIKTYFQSHDDLLRQEIMLTNFLTTLELPGLEMQMKIEFGEIKNDYFFITKTKEKNETSFFNEVVLEVPYTIIKRQTISCKA